MKTIITILLCVAPLSTAEAGRPLPWKKNMKKHDYFWRAPGSGGELTPSRGWGRKDDRGFGGGLDVWRVPPMRMTQRSETKGLFWAND